MTVKIKEFDLKIRINNFLRDESGTEHLHSVFGILHLCCLSLVTSTSGKVVYKPLVLLVSSEAPVPTIANLIPATDYVLLLHQIVIGPVTVHFNIMVLKYAHCI